MASPSNIVRNGTRVVIPLARGEAYTRQRVSLDGRPYTLDLAWNTRAGSWYISLSDAEEVPVASGLRLVPNWPLLRYHKWDPRCPQGEMFAQDEGSGSDIGFDDIGGDRPRVELVYYAVVIA
jgi:hypothetical protein